MGEFDLEECYIFSNWVFVGYRWVVRIIIGNVIDGRWESQGLGRLLSLTSILTRIVFALERCIAVCLRHVESAILIGQPWEVRLECRVILDPLSEVQETTNEWKANHNYIKFGFRAHTAWINRSLERWKSYEADAAVWIAANFYVCLATAKLNNENLKESGERVDTSCRPLTWSLWISYS